MSDTITIDRLHFAIGFAGCFFVFACVFTSIGDSSTAFAFSLITWFCTVFGVMAIVYIVQYRNQYKESEEQPAQEDNPDNSNRSQNNNNNNTSTSNNTNTNTNPATVTSTSANLNDRASILTQDIQDKNQSQSAPGIYPLDLDRLTDTESIDWESVVSSSHSVHLDTSCSTGAAASLPWHSPYPPDSNPPPKHANDALPPPPTAPSRKPRITSGSASNSVYIDVEDETQQTQDQPHTSAEGEGSLAQRQQQMARAPQDRMDGLDYTQGHSRPKSSVEDVELLKYQMKMLETQVQQLMAARQRS